MKYCYNCDRITAGEPLFCNFCGRSYNVKLCPRMHPNPRKAQACSKCGSRDLSTPQPKVPWWAPLLEFVLSCIPGVLLTIASALAALAVLREILNNPAALVALAMPLIALGILWWMWKQIPSWFRKAIYDLLKRKRDREDGRRD
ncbi:MAG: hypothetical protein ABSC08_18780 [Bryobacteraceae bacterium]|jgi:RNA polymerase subunit RPABC4/transcription elongation factor Spt4